MVEDEVFDGEIEKDHIISQLPRAESKVKEGREVTVVISLGPDEVQVPVLQGFTPNLLIVAGDAYRSTAVVEEGLLYPLPCYTILLIQERFLLCGLRRQAL